MSVLTLPLPPYAIRREPLARLRLVVQLTVEQWWAADGEDAFVTIERAT